MENGDRTPKVSDIKLYIMKQKGGGGGVHPNPVYNRTGREEKRSVRSEGQPYWWGGAEEEEEVGGGGGGGWWAAAQAPPPPPAVYYPPPQPAAQVPFFLVTGGGMYPGTLSVGYNPPPPCFCINCKNSSGPCLGRYTNPNKPPPPPPPPHPHHYYLPYYEPHRLPHPPSWDLYHHQQDFDPYRSVDFFPPYYF